LLKLEELEVKAVSNTKEGPGAQKEKKLRAVP
jgi:hypothetical protein